MKEIKEISELDNGINIIKFSAKWCRPCKKITPIIDKLEEELPKANFYNVDIGTSNDIATAFNISSIPSILILNGNKPLDMIVGTMDKTTIKNRINKHL